MPKTKRKAPQPQWRKLGYDSGYEHEVHQNDRKLDFHGGLKLSYVVAHNYEPDFTYPTSDEPGKPLVVETKGQLKFWDRQAFLAMYEQHKDKYAIKLLFQKECRLPHCKRLTNVDWAEKHGIPCAVGNKIPKQWYGE